MKAQGGRAVKLFINSGICEREWNGNVKITRSANKSQLHLTIPNYLEEEHKEESIKFVFNIGEISEESLKKDLLLENIFLRKTSRNSYRIEQAKKNSEQYMYALIRSTAVVPDDVFIPSSMKNNVTVIRRIRFVDDEVEYGDFLSNVYFIKIHLGCHESIPVYLAYENPYFLEEHYVFYRNECDGKYCVSERLKTFIYIDKYNENQYISLLELCK